MWIMTAQLNADLLLQSAKQIFRGADADGDRAVDADEFHAYMAEKMAEEMERAEEAAEAAAIERRNKKMAEMASARLPVEGFIPLLPCGASVYIQRCDRVDW